MNILVINCGSSSFKYQLINMERRAVRCSGLVERIGDPVGRLAHKKAPGTPEERLFAEDRPFADHATGMARVMDLLTDPAEGVLASLEQIDACGHRVVNGGEELTSSRRVDDAVLDTLRRITPLAPLHNPGAVQGMEVARALLPGVPSVAVFDTEFHATMPAHAYMYALPYEMYEKHGVRRYGFHGTSHRYVFGRAAKFLGREEASVNAVTCHLGNGCSVSAVQNGRCIDTSMGMTPLAGVVMGSRSGDIDPAILAYLARQTGMGLAELDAMLNSKSGMKGICGLNDMRDIHAAREKGDARAALAFDMFCHSVRKYIGAYFAVLGRVDALVFTAGIGENDSATRAAICARLENLGIALDPQKNAAPGRAERDVSLPGAAVRTLVIPTNEEMAIAEATARVLNAAR